MGKLVRFRQVSFDAVEFAPSTGRRAAATAFDATATPLEDEGDRVTDLDEASAVRWLMQHEPARHLVFRELGLPFDALHRQAVVQPFYAPGRGDIDLLICPPCCPACAVAVECKRVKIESLSAEHDRVNKLGGVRRGVQQANRLARGKFRFFKTWLAVIMEAESSRQTGINIPSRGVRANTVLHGANAGVLTFEQIVEFAGQKNLDRDVGIAFIELVQPSRLSIERRATVRACAYRSPEPRNQPDPVTALVARVLTMN